ncbi:MAG TPA: ABC transporter ATP-binding protein, partial [Vicinamibacterales bacterium]|nr:ABC transporter ATP-binding protein [Vicinamibacterales bacterium]
MATDGDIWAIDARGLGKTFGTAAVVRSVTLQVPSGTIFAFLGPNGSGKSTTVKLLTGLLAPTAGEARVCGRVVSVEDVQLRREIGVLPEDDALFPDLTIWEHLELCGRLYGIDCREATSRAIQLLRHLDLE